LTGEETIELEETTPQKTTNLRDGAFVSERNKREKTPVLSKPKAINAFFHPARKRKWEVNARAIPQFSAT